MPEFLSLLEGKLVPAKKINMKTKVCHSCKEEKTVLYRIQIEKGKIWIFVCDDCIAAHQVKPNYRYGGTWKGKRH